MFGSKNKRTSVELTKLSSLIAEDFEIVGDVNFTSGVRVDGRITGNVVVKVGVAGVRQGLLVVSTKGHIEGSVRCGDAVIDGTVVGDINIDGFLELHSNAHVSGTIRYRHLRMDVGAVVEGKLIKADATSTHDSNVVPLEMDRALAIEGR